MAYRFKTRSITPGASALKQGALTPVAGYPAVAAVADGVFFGTSGTEFEGEMVGGGGTVPAAGDVEYGVAVGFGIGTFVVPSVATVLAGIQYGNAAEFTGTAQVTVGAEQTLRRLPPSDAGTLRRIPTSL